MTLDPSTAASRARPSHEFGGTADDPIFQPLEFRSLTVKNRIFRSNISGRFDNYDGSGSPVRINCFWLISPTLRAPDLGR
jgi:hypothetical protein